MKQIKFTICVICLVLLNLCNSQLQSQINKLYSTDNGLSNSLINQIYQDKKGFIWIATEYGLNQFNGLQFSIYKHNESSNNSLQHNYVRCIFEDSTNSLYIGTLTGLMKYNWDRKDFDKIKLIQDGKELSTHVTAFTELKNGDVWLTTSGKGVFIKKKGESDFTYNSNINKLLCSIYLNSMYEDSQGYIWIGSENNGLNRYNPKNKEIIIYNQPSEISSQNISAIVEDSKGTVYVGTLTQGLNKFDRKTQKFTQVKHTNNKQLFISTLTVDNKDNVYIGTEGDGLMLYNKDKETIDDYNINYGLFDFSKGKIHSILLDKDNNIWLGFFQKGVVFIPSSKNKFDYFGYKASNNIIGSNSITTLHKDKEGFMWVGTDNDGMYCINPEGNKSTHYNNTLAKGSVPDIILSIHEDAQENLWLGSFTSGLARFNKKSKQCTYIPQFANQKIYSITEDNKGNLLVGTFGSGFYILNKDLKEIAHIRSSQKEIDILSVDELSNDWINTLLCDKDGLIWIGHYKGLSCYDPIKQTFFTFVDKNNMLPQTVVNYIYEASNGAIWIGSNSGLYCFNKKDKSFTKYTTHDGLSNDVICGICEDEEGNLWISTYKGINKLKTSDKTILRYYATDGLQGNEFSKGAVFKDKKGKLYFGGVNGFSSFYPKNIEENKKDMSILLNNLYLFNQPINKGDKSGRYEVLNTSVIDADKITLDHKDNTFTLEFTTLNYSSPERFTFQYMIKGSDEDWISTLPGINKITYNNLAPGKYVFMVRAYDNTNHSVIKTIEISIMPPWYKSWWAYLLYMILLLLLSYGIISYILSKIRHKQELIEKDHAEKISEAKLQFFMNISHEIRTPMTLIINPLEKLIKENTDQEKQNIYMMIYRNAQRILRLINQLMDIRKLDKGQMRLNYRKTNIIGFIEDLMLTFEYLATKKNINFEFEHKDENLNVWIDLNNFDKVILNILSNAFKYTQDNGEIKIILKTGIDNTINNPLNKYFEITIEDNGIGINEDQLEEIFERFYQINNDQTNSNFGTGIGLHLSRLLVELHKGIIYAENRKDTQGARFVVRLPLENLDLDQKNTENSLTSRTRDLETIKELEIQNDINNSANDKEGKKIRAKTKYKIILVEDEDEIRQYIKDELSNEYTIIEARDGKEALSYILKHVPDLIISDVMMPDMDGITLTRKVKQNININHIPVVLLTAKSKPEDRLEGLEIGADAYLTKPFNTDLLRETISNLIANRERLKSKFGGSQQPKDKIQQIELKSSDEILLERIMKVINENISNPDLNVEMLANNVGMSRVHMHRKLKELTNQSARDFIKGIRLNQAAYLLTSKKISISEVAYAIGYSNLSHFSNSFKEFFGTSPSEYTNNESKEES